MKIVTDKIYTNTPFTPHRLEVITTMLKPNWQDLIEPNLVQSLCYLKDSIHGRPISIRIPPYNPAASACMDLFMIPPITAAEISFIFIDNGFDMYDINIVNLVNININEAGLYIGNRLLMRALLYRMLINGIAAPWGPYKMNLSNAGLMIMLHSLNLIRTTNESKTS